jgi:hypothetical protein
MVNDFVNCVPLLYFSQLCGIRPLLKGAFHTQYQKNKKRRCTAITANTLCFLRFFQGSLLVGEEAFSPFPDLIIL